MKEHTQIWSFMFSVFCLRFQRFWIMSVLHSHNTDFTDMYMTSRRILHSWIRVLVIFKNDFPLLKIFLRRFAYVPVVVNLTAHHRSLYASADVCPEYYVALNHLLTCIDMYVFDDITWFQWSVFETISFHRMFTYKLDAQ